MRILYRMSGDETKASSRVRGYWIASELGKLGHATSVAVCDGKADYLRVLSKLRNVDCVIFQKTFSRYDVWTAALARRMGKLVLTDIDDAPSRDRGATVYRRAAALFRSSHAVMAGSAALVELVDEIAGAGSGLARHVPTAICLGNYSVRPALAVQGETCIGWIGNGAQYADDLVDILHEPLASLAKRFPVRLKIVGACGDRRLHEAFSALPDLKVELVDAIDWSDPKEVNAAICSFDIGVYPLSAGGFNEYKCAFKALEYMACGIPVVASPVGANSRIVTDGITGYLARSTEDWEHAIEILISDPDVRRAFGLAGRQIVETRFTTKRVAEMVDDIIDTHTTGESRALMKRADAG